MHRNSFNPATKFFFLGFFQVKKKCTAKPLQQNYMSSFGWKSQTYSAYVHLLIVKLWNRLYYGANDEPERVGEAYSSIWDKWDDFWSNAPSEVLPNLFVGSAKNAADAGSLHRLNIQYVVNATEDLPNFHEGVRMLRIQQGSIGRYPGCQPCRRPRSVDFVVAKIIKNLSENKAVLVHCFMGASDVSIATLAVMKIKGISAVEAYGKILSERKAAKINRSFMRDLQGWDF